MSAPAVDRPMIRRRTFVIALGLTGFSGPAVAAAQGTGRMPRVGYISNVPPSTLLADAWRKAFVDGLREQGWVEGQNVVIERRYAALRDDASQVVVEELLRLGVDVLVVSSTSTARRTRSASLRA